LLDPRLDEVIFGLKPGEYSNVVESAAGFHIFKVLERDASRALSPDVKLVLQKQALRTWLDARRAQSQIELLLH
jgi:parvulin-like peptidyl-prolyl isomerase